MIHFSRRLKRLPVAVAFVMLGALVTAGVASAGHPMNGTTTTLEGGMVQVYKKCNVGGTSPYQANHQHHGPLPVPACGPGGTTNGPGLQTGGGGKNAVGPDTNLPVWSFAIRFTKPGVGAPCANGQVGSTVCLNASIDSLCTYTTQTPPYTCGAPFAGTLGFVATIRFTDNYNCVGFPCPNPATGPYTTQATGTDTDFGPVPVTCAIGGDGKSHCTLNTDANTVLAGAVVNGFKTNLQIHRIRAVILSAPHGGTAQALLAQQGLAWP